MPSRRYTVTVQGRLGERFRATFPGVSIEPEPGHTRLVTEPFDQGQLHGLLSRVRDFGLDLLAVEAMPPPPTSSVVAAPTAAEAKKANHPGETP
jgi:hypothetical protein